MLIPISPFVLKRRNILRLYAKNEHSLFDKLRANGVYPKFNIGELVLTEKLFIIFDFEVQFVFGFFLGQRFDEFGQVASGERQLARVALITSPQFGAGPFQFDFRPPVQAGQGPC